MSADGTSILDQLMAEAKAALEGRTYPDVSWAQRIVQRRIDGERISPLVLKMAREALENVRSPQSREPR